MTRTARLVCLLVAGLAACRDGSDAPASAPVANAAPAASVAARAAAPPPSASAASDYVPAEHKLGAARWKDTGLYVDGKPVSFLNFGELPITLRPTWVKVKVDAERRPGTNDPTWRWSQQRYYKVNDYLRALGIAPASVRQIHIYGPKDADTIIATGRDLASPKGEQLMFHFGGSVKGKAIPRVPDGFGNGGAPDKIASIMVYIKKAPPVLVPNDGFYLDGRPVDGVPYYGEPLRGGVRVYLDDKLATIIKRQDLDPKDAAPDAAGDPTWSLYAFLKAHGVDTSHVVEGWTIKDELRTRAFVATDLAGLRFGATAQAKGVVTLGADKEPANAIALHTRHVTPDMLPVVTPDDDE